MAVTLRSVTGRFLNKQIASVSFIPTSDVTIDGTDSITKNLPLVVAEVDPDTGTFTATGLPPTSGTGIVPTGWTYRVEVNSVQSRGPLRVFEVQIAPYTGTGTAPVLQLASLAPVASPGEIALYLTEEAADQRYVQPDVLNAYVKTVDLEEVDLTPYAKSAAISKLLLIQAGTPDAMVTGDIVRDSNGAATGFDVVWPDGATGRFTGTASTSFPGAIDAYTITHVVAPGGSANTTTYTQAAVTRDANGAVTKRPAITVA